MSRAVYVAFDYEVYKRLYFMDVLSHVTEAASGQISHGLTSWWSAINDIEQVGYMCDQGVSLMHLTHMVKAYLVV